MADLEDRTKRNNQRLVGLPEGSEGDDAVSYLQISIPKWFPSLAGREFEVMWAHRVYGGGAEKAVRPRTLILSLLRYSDWQVILRACRAEPLCLTAKDIRFFPISSNYTGQRIRAFSPLVHLAKERGIQAFLFYPATLKIIRGTERHLCKSPGDTGDLLNSFQ
ncbi:hypothetical protein AAFF_G00244260 [Aldrovandia affinis]|uniref:Uncharacterized protein n=1 Tax=Aldrovandia affinis TaxID=143900 RepID=A0AAD7W3N3_9TELE|nr:hypothetical protein AAFF_G00244260 [Aldrovandia affinis]